MRLCRTGLIFHHTVIHHTVIHHTVIHHAVLRNLGTAAFSW